MYTSRNRNISNISFIFKIYLKDSKLFSAKIKKCGVSNVCKCMTAVAERKERGKWSILFKVYIVYYAW